MNSNINFSNPLIDYQRLKSSPSNAEFYAEGILSLPDDVLAKIISIEPLISRLVCRRLFKLVWRKSLLKDFKIVLKGDREFISQWIYLHRFNCPSPYLTLDFEEVSDDSEVEKILSEVAKLATLKGVEIKNACYPSQNAMKLLKVPSLESLVVPRICWDSEFDFKPSKSLRELRITEGVKAVDISFLKYYPNLQKLWIPFSKNYSSLSMVKNLSEFRISQPYKVDFSCLQNLPNLVTLAIPAQEEGFEHVQQLPRLKVLKLCNSRTGLDLRKLHQMTSLIQLDLIECDGSVWHPEALSKLALNSLSMPSSWSNSEVKRVASGKLRNSLDKLQINDKHRLSLSQDSLKAISAFENLKKVSFKARSIAASCPLDWSPILELKNLKKMEITKDMDIEKSFEPEVLKLQTLKGSAMDKNTGKAEPVKPILLESRLTRRSTSGCRIAMKIFEAR